MEDKIGIDDFILECWAIDESGWKFVLFSDLWWEIKAESEDLGEFRAQSLSHDDVEVTLAKLLDQVRKVADAVL